MISPAWTHVETIPIDSIALLTQDVYTLGSATLTIDHLRDGRTDYRIDAHGLSVMADRWAEAVVRAIPALTDVRDDLIERCSEHELRAEEIESGDSEPCWCCGRDCDCADLYGDDAQDEWDLAHECEDEAQEAQETINLLQESLETPCT